MKLRNKYRVVTDNYCGYEAQVKFWWFPFVWLQMSGSGWGINTFSTKEEAIEFIKHGKKVVWHSEN